MNATADLATPWTDAVSPDPMEGRCIGTSRSGARCKRWPAPGASVCRMHGGAAPQVRAKAEERVKDQKARVLLASLGVPVRTDPITALQVCLDEAFGNLDVLRAVIRERTAAADPDESLDGLIRLYMDERDRLHRVAKDSVALGIELRRSELGRDEMTAVVAVWKDVLADPSIGLTAAQGEAISRGVGASLRELNHVETREIAGLAG